MTISRDELLVQGYLALREDERSSGGVAAALYSVAVAVLGGTIAILSRICFEPGSGGCSDLGLVVAVLPLGSTAVMSLLAWTGAASAARSFYLRDLERQIINRAPNHAGVDSVFLAPMHVFHGIVSTRRGLLRFRMLPHTSLGVLGIAHIGIVGVSVALVHPIELQVAAASIHTFITALLALAAWSCTVGGRDLWVKLISTAKEYLTEPLVGSREGKWSSPLWSYLVLPRPGDLIKSLFVILGSALAMLVGRSGVPWSHLLLATLVFEYFLYQARYQLNDIRDYGLDDEHPFADERRRLPMPTTTDPGKRHQAMRQAVLSSLLAMILRLTLWWILADALGSPADRLLKAAGIAALAIAIVYELVKKRMRSGGDLATYTLLSWVGTGYALRVWLGISLVPGIRPLSVAMIVLTAGVFGCAVVCMTWALEASAFAAETQRGWRFDTRLQTRLSHRLLLRHLGIESDAWAEELPRGSTLAKARALDSRRRSPPRSLAFAPWNLFSIAAMAAAGGSGFALTTSSSYVIAAGVLAGLVIGCLATRFSAPFTVMLLVAGALAFALVGSANQSAERLAQAVPLGLVGFSLVAFRTQSYDGLAAAGRILSPARLTSMIGKALALGLRKVCLLALGRIATGLLARTSRESSRPPAPR